MIADVKWTSESTSLVFSAPTSFPFETLIASLEISAEVDGRSLRPEKWNIHPDGHATATLDGIELAVTLKPLSKNQSGRVLVVSAVNRTGANVRLRGFRFAVSRREQGNDFVSIPSSRIRLHKEGWSMTSAAGSVRLGEKDFTLNPDYKPFSVSSVADYDDANPNRFSAESVLVLNDKQTGACLLLGFISSADQITRMSLHLDEKGVTQLDAFSHGDNIVVPPGGEVRSEEFIVMTGLDGYALLETFGALWGERMGATSWDHTPVGWCSWPYYSWQVTEQNMLENAQWLHENRGEFPLEYLQMDDGFQSALGDWLIVDAKKFPSGLEFLASEIKSAGMKPGLWVAPFLVEECSQLYASHPEWMIRDQSGQTIWALDWRDTSRTAVLDCTIPAACDWLTETFSTLSNWGFEYFKLDFLVHECGALSKGGVYSDPSVTRAQAIRRGLLAIRKGVGNRFLLGCTSVLGASIGVINGCRISSDIATYWENRKERHYKEAPSMPNVCRNVINRRYMHRHLWLNDPDTHIARTDNSTLTESEIRLWTSALWLAGGMLLLGDRFNTLTPERAALSKMLIGKLESFDVTRPLDFFEQEVPALWLGTRTATPNEMTLGVFNFTDEPKAFPISLAALGAKPGAKFQVSEFWEGANLGIIVNDFETEVPPHSCKVFDFKIA